MVDDEGRIVMRLEQARAYRGTSVAELARRVGVDRKLRHADAALPTRLLHPRSYKAEMGPRRQGRTARPARGGTGARTHDT